MPTLPGIADIGHQRWNARRKSLPAGMLSNEVQIAQHVELYQGKNFALDKSPLLLRFLKKPGAFRGRPSASR